MYYCGKVIFGFMVFCLLLHGPLTSGEADDLKPPLLLSTEVVDEPPLDPGCTLPAAGPLQKSLLIVRDTPRIVGPYTVNLPGYATDPNDTAHDSYRPFLIRAKPGDSLRLDLANQLPVVTTNDGDGSSPAPTHSCLRWGWRAKLFAELQEVEVMCLNNAEDRVLRVDLTRSMSAVMIHQESAREI
jgi:hypothetical protein